MLDSLNRGFDEKSNPDFLILEINSSRYAYNMALSEVNFYVVKAILNLRHISEANANNFIGTINQVLSHLGPVFKNYIRGDDAMMDCLKAIEVSLFTFLGVTWVYGGNVHEHIFAMGTGDGCHG